MLVHLSPAYGGVFLCMIKVRQNFYCKSINCKWCYENTFPFLWNVTQLQPTFATPKKGSAKRDSFWFINHLPHGGIKILK